MKKALILLVSTLTVWGLSAQDQPKSGDELFQMMFNSHKGKWYQTLCFSQEVLHYQNDSIISTDVWHEAYLSPSTLILKFSDWNSGNGIIFAHDSLFTFHDGKLQSVRYRIHDLLVLGLDVNNIDPKITAERARKTGYDLSRIDSSTCMGHSAWVVGDTTKLCFWVDKKSLLFLKMRRTTGENSREVEFARYDFPNGFPVATEIYFYNTLGKLEMVEKYFNVRPNAAINPEIYDPKKFIEARW